MYTKVVETITSKSLDDRMQFDTQKAWSLFSDKVKNFLDELNLNFDRKDQFSSGYFRIFIYDTNYVTADNIIKIILELCRTSLCKKLHDNYMMSWENDRLGQLGRWLRRRKRRLSIKPSKFNGKCKE